MEYIYVFGASGLYPKPVINTIRENREDKCFTKWIHLKRSFPMDIDKLLEKKPIMNNENGNSFF